MIISPTHRLLAAIALWTLASALAVALPVLWPAVVLAGVGLVGAVLGDAWPLVRSPPALLARRAPERLAVGRKAEVELSLHNPSSAPLFADVFDELPRDLVQTDPAFPRVRVPAGTRHVLRYEVVPQVRGDRVLGPALALVHSPLGLLRRRIVAGAGQKLAVYPDTSRFMRPEALDPKRVLASMGVKRARQRGEGMDFESLREYVPGDDPRRIDWPATARRGRLVTRLYQHEHNHSVTIAVDASRLMGGRFRGRTKLDYAVDSALALVYAALASNDRAGLVVFDRELRAHLAPHARRADLGRFVELLRPIQPRLVEADYRALVRGLLSRQQKRSLIVILTDFAAVSASVIVAPLALLARHHRVLLVAVRDRVFETLAVRPGGDPDRRGLAGQPPGSERGIYRRLVLDDLLREREETLARLRQRGLHTLDLAPAQITASVLNSYLALRYG